MECLESHIYATCTVPTEQILLLETFALQQMRKKNKCTKNNTKNHDNQQHLLLCLAEYGMNTNNHEAPNDDSYIAMKIKMLRATRRYYNRQQDGT